MQKWFFKFFIITGGGREGEGGGTRGRLQPRKLLNPNGTDSVSVIMPNFGS